MSGIHKHGARFRFDYRSRDEAEVRYRARIILPDATCHEYTLRASVQDDALSIEPLQAKDLAEDWMLANLTKLANQMVTKARRSGTWPRKLQRWREG